MSERPLTNARHELFCILRAQGLTLDQAYSRAGYTPSLAHAARLAANGNIRARIAALQAGYARAAQITVESLLEEAEAMRQGAMREGAWAAAVNALKEKGILSGLRIERRRTETVPSSQLTDEQLLEIAMRENRQAALGAGRTKAPAISDGQSVRNGGVEVWVEPEPAKAKRDGSKA